MFQEERFKIILDLLSIKESVKVSELSDILDASVATVRRDLETLQNQGAIVRTHGGAMRFSPVGTNKTFKTLESERTAEKALIASFSLKYIHSGETVYLDESSSVLALAKAISAAPPARLTVVTSSLNVLNLLSGVKNCQVILTGGMYDTDSASLCGYQTIQYIKSIRVDKCFIGINGVDSDFGLSTPRLNDSELKTAVIASSKVSYALADHTKFGECFFSSIADTDFIITDSRLSDFDYAALENRFELLFADETAEEG